MTRHAFVFAAVLAVSASASAQSTDISEVRRKARAQAGPVYLTPAIELKELGVDSNVFNAPGDERSDFTVTVTPRVDVWIPVARRALVKAKVAADLVWFARYTSERSVDPQIVARAETYFRRLTLFAENAYLDTRQRPNHEIDVRSRRFENTALGGVGLTLTPKLSIQATARRFHTRYDADAGSEGADLQRTLNRTATGVQATAHHRLTPFTTIGLRYDNLLDRFEFVPARDARSSRVMPGVEFSPGALINGRAYVGYREFTPVRPDVLPAFNGLVAELELTYTLLGATSFGVRFRRDLAYSYEEEQPYFVENIVGGYVRRALGSRFDVLLSADRHRYEYEDFASGRAGSNVAPQRIDHTWNYAASVGYRMGRHGRVGFGVSYWARHSTTRRFRDYNSLRIGTTASYGF